MRVRFKYQIKIHFIGIGIVFIIYALALITEKLVGSSPYDIIFWICVLTAILGVVNNFFTYYYIDEKGILLKGIVKSNRISWDEIECIMLQPAGKFVSFSVGIFSKTNRISITPWTSNYKDLLKLVIDKCVKEGKVKVEPKVLELIK